MLAILRGGRPAPIISSCSGYNWSGMAECQKMGSGWLEAAAGRGTGKELFKAWQNWECSSLEMSGLQTQTHTQSLKGGREVIFSLSAAIASSELHERMDWAWTALNNSCIFRFLFPSPKWIKTQEFSLFVVSFVTEYPWKAQCPWELIRY